MSDHSNYPDNPIDVDRLVRRLNYYGSIIEKLLAFKIPNSVAFLEKKIVALEEMILKIPINDDEVEDESSAYQELVDVWRDSVVCLWKRLFDVAALASTTNSAFIDVSSTSAGCGNVNCNRNSKATQATPMKSSGAESRAPSPLQKQKKVLAQPDAMSVPSTSADGPRNNRRNNRRRVQREPNTSTSSRKGKPFATQIMEDEQAIKIFK